MSQTLVRNFVHVIYSTKYRAHTIPMKISAGLYAYKAGICKELGCTPIKIGGFRDRVHVLINLSKNHGLSEAMGIVKSNSTTWMKGQGVRNFEWQNGYAVYSVGEHGIVNVKRYIEEQEEHHGTNKVDFKVELIKLLKENGVEYDERYLWT